MDTIYLNKKVIKTCGKKYETKIMVHFIIHHGEQEYLLIYGLIISQILL